MKAAQQNHSSRFALVLVIITLCFASVALAGPPLICHAFEIGQAKSLPLASDSWNLSGSENYDTNKLANDTLEILQPDTPVLVRMETLRRATLYARKDPLAAKALHDDAVGAVGDAQHARDQALDLEGAGSDSENPNLS